MPVERTATGNRPASKPGPEPCSSPNTVSTTNWAMNSRAKLGAAST